MRSNPVALCVIRFERRGQEVAMTVKISRDVEQRGPSVEFTTFDVEEVVEIVRSLARQHWALLRRLDGVDDRH